MHIEPGILAPAKVIVADGAALILLAAHARRLCAKIDLLPQTALAALFFSLFMQAFHMQVGPSELHFVGAMAIYLTLGFIPTLFGFAFGLLLQGLLFDPQDLPHLAVNSLSLMVPLLLVHHTLGRRLLADAARGALRWQAIMRADALYYSGVTAMVGFWLLISEVETPLASWSLFASSYLVLVLCEPLFTLATVRLLHRHGERRWISYIFLQRIGSR
ncbi:MAG: energy-coupling factor ABC transporter permease [Mariprofundales bacterium]